MPPIIDRRYGVAQGLAVKAPVAVATTGNIMLSGLQTIDTYTTLENDRVLVWQQSDATLNGIYLASPNGWTRDLDFDGPYDIIVGTRVFVINGATNGLIEFYVTAFDGTVDEDDITFDQTFNYVVGTANLVDHAVTNVKFRQSAGLSVVGRASNSTGDVADITAASDGQVLRRSGTAIGFGAIDLTSANAVTGALGATNGGTGLSSYAQGDLIYASAINTLAKLAKDANATRYLANTGTSNNPAWAQVNLANGVTGTLPVGNGGTGLTGGTSGGVLYYSGASTLASSALLTQYGVVYGGGAGGAPVATAAMTNGQLLVGQTGAAPAPTTLSGDATLNAAGALTLATVNGNLGSFGSASNSLSVTVNAKGLITAISQQSISITSTQVSDFTEAVQDVIGAAWADTATIDFTYNDAGNSMSAIVIDNSITDAKLRQSSGLSVIGRSANTTGNVADITGVDGNVLRVSGTTLGFGSIATAGITDAAVTLAKMADLAQSTFIGRAAGAGTGVPTALTATQATAILNVMVGDSGSGGTKGLVPAPAAGDAAAARFLKADGTWQIPSAGGGGDVIAANNLSEYTATASTARGNISAAKSGANTDITSVLLNQTGLVVKGATANGLTIKPNETLTAGRTLNIVTGDADRTLTFAGNATISGTNSGDQTITLTGDVTGTGTGSFAATIAANAVTDAKFRQSAGLSVVGRASNTTGNTADITAASDNQVLRRSGTAIAFGSIDLSQSNTVGTSILPIANGGTNASTAASALTNLGAAKNVDFQEFLASGTWTKPSGFSADATVYVEVVGGGCSGTRNTTASSAIGGAGGAANYGWYKLSDLGATETVTVGAGGAARTGSNQSGAAGGNTTFKGLIGYGAVDNQSNDIFNQQGAAQRIATTSGSAATNASAAKQSIMGGGGGGAASTNTSGAAGILGGSGGNGGTGGTATAGAQPGGGGGGDTSTSGAGGAGRVRVWVFDGL